MISSRNNAEKSEGNEDLLADLAKRILILDGAMGTQLRPPGFRRNFCCDMLNLSNPQAVEKVHTKYLQAGADIIETNTFNANRITLSRLGLQDNVAETNRAAARIAKRAASNHFEATGKTCHIAGCIGPIVGISDSTTLEASYYEQIASLLAEGIGLLLIETILDTRNLKAAANASKRACAFHGKQIGLIFSATPTAQGSLFSGETIEQFIATASAYRPIALGLNCGFGTEHLTKLLPRFSAMTDCATLLYPNTGISTVKESPEVMAATIEEALSTEQINIIGGCCDTTPIHIQTLSELAKRYQPRPLLLPNFSIKKP